MSGFDDVLEKLAVVMHIGELERQVEFLKDALAYTVTNILKTTHGVNNPIKMMNDTQSCKGLILMSRLHDNELTLTILQNEDSEAPFKAASEQCPCPQCTKAKEDAVANRPEGYTAH
jgi:hypothetical protein